MIRLSGVTYSYPGAGPPALASVDLEVEPGELLVVTGNSGGGKSTLLRTMNGLVPQFHGGELWGSVTVNGTDVVRTRPRELAGLVGFVGQDPEDHGVVDRVEDDIAFTLENLGMEPVSMRKRVEEVLDALGLAGLRSRKLEDLSGGERQRVAIAGALVAMPAHLVLDEPTSQLDPQSAEEVLGALLRLRDEIGVSVVLAEHRLERVIQYADRLCLIESGKSASGDPRALLRESVLGPPVTQLGRRLDWSPLPLSLREARRLASALDLVSPEPAGWAAPGEIVAGVSGLTVSLGSTQALRGVDLSFRSGEAVAIMGRNGSGKSTLLRAVAGLIKNPKGHLTRAPAVGLLPQNPGVLLYRATVEAELAASLRARKKPSGRRETWALADEFGLLDLLGRHPRDLSGGQRTRVALVAIAAGGPPLLLLDEPTRGADTATKGFLEKFIRERCAAGAAVLLATHDVELAARVATRVVLLGDGEVIADGPPRMVLAESLTFSTQMNKVFGDPRILTLDDALAAVGAPR